MKTTIIVVVLLGLSAVAGSIIVGSSTFDGLVVDKPYETGLSWDKVRNESAATGWQADIRNATIRSGNDELVINIFDSKGNSLKDAEVSITISRPSTKAYDKVYKTEPGENGFYRVAVSFPLYGYWDLKISILKEGKHAGFEKRIFVEKGV